MIRSIIMILLSASVLIGCKGQKPSPEKGGGETATPSIITERVRPPAQAGGFYPSDPVILKGQVNSYLKRVEIPSIAGDIIALISPHAGYTYSGRAAAYGYKLLGGREFNRVIILGPTHYASFRGASIPAVDYYETPLGRVPLDLEICKALLKKELFSTVPQAHGPEHSIEVQLPFLQEVLSDFKIVPVLIGFLTNEDYGKIAGAIAKHLNSRTLVVASSDFTHYGRRFGYMPFVEDTEVGTKARLGELDQGAIDLIIAGDFDGLLDYLTNTGITICGRMPIAVLLKLLPEGAKGKLLDYYTSIDLTGDYSSSVSYASICFTGQWPQPPPSQGERGGNSDEEKNQGETMGLSREEKRELLHIARTTIEKVVQGEKVPEFKVSSGVLKEDRGAFVTIHKHGQLRGCIGYILPVKPLGLTVREMAESSALNDYRFPPVSPEELKDISIEISVLSVPQRVTDVAKIVMGKHGVIVKRGPNQGVFLPQVADETGWDRETFLSNLCAHKAGLPPDAWKDENTVIETFTAEVFGEEELE